MIVTSFYQFKTLSDYTSHQMHLRDYCKSIGIKGTILLAYEGLNATISGTREAINQLYAYLQQHLGITVNNQKENEIEEHPFQRMKVRLKKEIVTMGVENLPVNELRGKYIKPEEWDEFISRSDVMVIDTRNTYEVALGTFKGAVNPLTHTFRQFPSWAESSLIKEAKAKNLKVAMFCTGGIRCEKSTAYLRAQGIEEAYHLEGGIIAYLQAKHNKEHMWEGQCFVFDDRVAIDAALQPTHALRCEGCGDVLTTDDLKRQTGENILIRCASCNGDVLELPSSSSSMVAA